MLEAHSEFLVDERSVRAVDDVTQDHVGVVDAQHILLLHQRAELPVQITGDSQFIENLRDFGSRGIDLILFSEYSAVPLKQRRQTPLRRPEPSKVSLSEPLAEILTVSEYGRGRVCRLVLRP